MYIEYMGIKPLPLNPCCLILPFLVWRLDIRSVSTRFDRHIQPESISLDPTGGRTTIASIGDGNEVCWRFGWFVSDMQLRLPSIPRGGYLIGFAYAVY